MHCKGRECARLKKKWYQGVKNIHCIQYRGFCPNSPCLLLWCVYVLLYIQTRGLRNWSKTSASRCWCKNGSFHLACEWVRYSEVQWGTVRCSTELQCFVLLQHTAKCAEVWRVLCSDNALECGWHEEKIGGRQSAPSRGALSVLS